MPIKHAFLFGPGKKWPTTPSQFASFALVTFPTPISYRQSIIAAEFILLLVCPPPQHGCDYKSFGIDVAKLAGVPSSVEKRAREILSSLEQNGRLPGKTRKRKTLQEDGTRSVHEACLINALVQHEGSAVASSGTSRETPGNKTGNHMELQGSEVVKTLLSIDPEVITPKQALDLIFELRSKVESKRR